MCSFYLLLNGGAKAVCYFEEFLCTTVLLLLVAFWVILVSGRTGPGCILTWKLWLPETQDLLLFNYFMHTTKSFNVFPFTASTKTWNAWTELLFNSWLQTRSPKLRCCRYDPWIHIFTVPLYLISWIIKLNLLWLRSSLASSWLKSISFSWQPSLKAVIYLDRMFPWGMKGQKLLKVICKYLNLVAILVFWTGCLLILCGVFFKFV